MLKVRDIQEKRERMGEEFTHIPMFKGFSIREVPDLGKNIYYNDNFSYLGDNPDFVRYSQRMLEVKTVGYKRTTTRRMRPIRRLVTCEPKEILGEEIIDSILLEASITCNTAYEVKLYPGYDPITSIPHRPSTRDRIDPAILVSFSLVSREFYLETGCHPILLSNGTIRSTCVVNQRGITDAGCPNTTSKLFLLEGEAGDPSRLVHQWDKYLYSSRLNYDYNLVPFDLPSKRDVFNYEKHKKASAGFCEVDTSVENRRLAKELKKLQGKYFAISQSKRPKKNSAAGITVDRLYDVMGKVIKILKQGGFPESGAFNLSRLIVQFKKEIGILVDFYDLTEGFEEWDQKSAKFKNKLRAFWSDSQLKVLIDRIIMTPGIDFVKGGSMSQICAIGCNVIGGSFTNLMMRLSLNEKFIEPKLRIIIKTIYRKYPSLQNRVYAEMDFEKYDSLVSALNILIGTAYMNTMAYDYDSVDSLTEKLMDWIGSVSVTFNTYKYAWVPYLGKIFYFIGRVPSGSLSTSALDSIAQIILRYMFIDEVIADYRDAGDREMVEKLYFTKEYLLVALIYGDDRTEGIPEELYHIIGLLPFANWLKKEWKWRVKFIIPDPSKGQPIDFFPHPYGEVYFERKGKYYVMTRKTNSPTFLKTKIKKVYVKNGEETICLGLLPFRETTDLMPKLTNSMSASSHPIKYLCSLISIMYLSVGNLEVFSIAARQFETYKEAFMRKSNMSEGELKGKFREFQQYFEDNPDSLRSVSNSMRRVFRMGLCVEKPSWARIFAKHNEYSNLPRKQVRTFTDEMASVSPLEMTFRPLPLSFANRMLDFMFR